MNKEQILEYLRQEMLKPGAFEISACEKRVQDRIDWLEKAHKHLLTELHQAKTKVDDLYNLFSYAEQDEDVLEMTGGVPLIGWLREREEREWLKDQETEGR